MKVRVKFYAQLRDLIGASERVIETGDEANVSDLLEKLYQTTPSLRAHDKGILVGAGVEFVGRDYRLKADETISVMPPVQGG